MIAPKVSGGRQFLRYSMSTSSLDRSQLPLNGILVLDFFNPTYVLSNLVSSETVDRQGISFIIKRWSDAGYLYKSIDFTDRETTYSFVEKVELVSKNDFLSYAAQAGLQLVDFIKGSYSLTSFDEINSPRMIFIWSKN
jgi:hypothetical protein